jgi:hypothetical protein
VQNFGARHGETSLTCADGALVGSASDGSTFALRPPLGTAYADEPDVDAFVESCAPPPTWGVLLVRKGGFAVARLEGDRTVESKTGQRHVQGRTKAGGQSQQRIIGSTRLVVTGGDHDAVEAVLADRRLARVQPVGPWLPVPDPRRSVLEQAVADALSVQVEVVNAS